LKPLKETTYWKYVGIPTMSVILVVDIVTLAQMKGISLALATSML
jgi:hypothetical protein